MTAIAPTADIFEPTEGSDWRDYRPGPNRLGCNRGATMRGYILVALSAAFAYASPAGAHHPGADIDKFLGSKEKFFQVIDQPAPSFDLADAHGNIVTLANHSDKVVVLFFLYARCPDVCPLHAEKIAEIQAMINQTPMKDMVRFIAITTDPKNDTSEVLKSYATVHGLDPVNWTFLTTKPGQQEGRTRAMAKAYGHKFTRIDDSYQAHGIVTHIIDRKGRWAANFHGLRFEAVNMVLYINGLINKARPPARLRERGWWETLKQRFK